jgi:hypothetical protein
LILSNSISNKKPRFSNPDKNMPNKDKIDDNSNSKINKSKAHYPKSSIDYQKIISKILKSNRGASHKKKLIAYIKEITSQEIETLRSYFNLHTGREDLFNTLKNILENINDEIKRNCDEDIIFIPESKPILPPDTNNLKSLHSNLLTQLEGISSCESKFKEFKKIIESALTTTVNPEKESVRFYLYLPLIKKKNE